MTAFLLPALAIGAAVSIVLSTLTVALPGTAYAIGRFRARRRRTFTDLTLAQPPVPQPAPHWCEYGDCPACMAATAAAFPADVTLEELETAAYRAEFAAIVCEEFPYERQRFQS